MNNGTNGCRAAHAAEAKRLNDEIERYDRAVDRALRKKPREAYTSETPLESIFASEGAPHCPRCDFQLEARPELEEWGIRNETIKAFAYFVKQDGVEPWKVMRNVFAVFAHMGIEPFCSLTVRERGLMLGDSHGSQHFRMGKMVNAVRKHGSASFKAPGQKQIEAQAVFSKCQQGNTNRRRRPRPRHPHLREKLRKQAHI